MSLRSTTAFAAGAVVALVLGTGTAYAATGGTFRLGYANSATRTTTLTNGYGSALQLNSKLGYPSLRVNRNTKVPLLNADLVDGVDSTSLARVTRVATITANGVVDDAGTPGDPLDDAVVAVAVCPTGSQVLGGGAMDVTDDGVPVLNIPNGTDSWLVVSSTQTFDADNASRVQAFARCWNPRANLADQTNRVTARSTVTSLAPQARQLVAKVAAQH